MPEFDDDPTPTADTSRRTVLRGALVLGAAGVLTACGGSSSDNNAAAQAPATDTGATTPPETTPSPSAAAKPKKSAKPKASATPTTGATAKATSAPKGKELGPVSGVPVGGGMIYDSAKIVVTQPKAGEFHAFSAICTHQTCLLADCDGGTINCGCHASKFALATGKVLNGPATVDLPVKKVTVSGGKVYEA